MKKNIFTICFLFILASVLMQERAAAQTPSPFIFITWRADAYAPADFQGKVMPTAYTGISAGVEVISGGRTVDLSQATVNWYWNNDLIASGENLRQVTLNAPETSGTVNDLRVEISGAADGFLVKTVEVPVVRPEAVIEAPFPERRFSGQKIILAARPYFFNSPAAGLEFAWRVNGQEPAVRDNSGLLEVNLSPEVTPGFEVKAELTVTNPQALFESAAKSLSLIFGL